MKAWWLFPLWCAMSACSTAPVKCETQIVKVPVAVVDAPPVVITPTLPITTITPKSSDDDVIRSYVESITALKAYTNELEQIVQHYKDESKQVGDNK